MVNGLLRSVPDDGPCARAVYAAIDGVINGMCVQCSGRSGRGQHLIGFCRCWSALQPGTRRLPEQIEAESRSATSWRRPAPRRSRSRKPPSSAKSWQSDQGNLQLGLAYASQLKELGQSDQQFAGAGDTRPASSEGSAASHHLWQRTRAGRPIGAGAGHVLAQAIAAGSTDWKSLFGHGLDARPAGEVCRSARLLSAARSRSRPAMSRC